MNAKTRGFPDPEWGVHEDPCIPTVHERMNLDTGLFLEAGADLEAAMKQLSIGDAEIQEMMCALISLRGMVLPAEGDA